jgi:hypothetical protein
MTGAVPDAEQHESRMRPVCLIDLSPRVSLIRAAGLRSRALNAAAFRTDHCHWVQESGLLPRDSQMSGEPEVARLVTDR